VRGEGARGRESEGERNDWRGKNKIEEKEGGARRTESRG